MIETMNKRKVTNKIIIHCTATPEGKDYSMDTIRKWHKEKGFADVGYHYVIHLDGRVEQGRPEDRVGAHCVGQNSVSIGISYVGGCMSDAKTPKDTRTEAQKTALRDLIDKLRQTYGNIPVYGHRNFAKKACPCFDAKSECN